MKQTDELKELRDEVFRGIGRNVLILQKMEGILKALVATTNMSLPKTGVENALEELRESVSKKSLGRLVGEFVQSVSPDSPGGRATPKTSEKPGIEVSLTFEDGSAVKDWEASLRGIVEERNDLIHNKLMEFDPNSIASCRAFDKKLGDQRERLSPEFKNLSSLWSVFQKLLVTALDQMDADDAARSEGR